MSNKIIRSEPPEYYYQRITSQYQGYLASPKFLAWVQALLQPVMDLVALLNVIEHAFDVDFAVGVQLDMLGTIVGVPRTLPFQPSNGISPILADDDYRTLLLATIGRNYWDGKVSSLQPLWLLIFPGGRLVVIDNQDMSMDVWCVGNLSSIVKDMIVHDMIVPRPETVKINYRFPEIPCFGFDLDNDYIAGFDKGHWCGGRLGG